MKERPRICLHQCEREEVVRAFLGIETKKLTLPIFFLTASLAIRRKKYCAFRKCFNVE